MRPWQSLQKIYWQMASSARLSDILHFFPYLIVIIQKRDSVGLSVCVSEWVDRELVIVRAHPVPVVPRVPHQLARCKCREYITLGQKVTKPGTKLIKVREGWCLSILGRKAIVYQHNKGRERESKRTKFSSEKPLIMQVKKSTTPGMDESLNQADDSLNETSGGEISIGVVIDGCWLGRRQSYALINRAAGPRPKPHSSGLEPNRVVGDGRGFERCSPAHTSNAFELSRASFSRLTHTQ